MKKEKEEKKNLKKKILVGFGFAVVVVGGGYLIWRNREKLFGTTSKELAKDAISSLKSIIPAPEVVLSEEVTNDMELVAQMVSACNKINQRFFEATGKTVAMTVFSNRLGNPNGQVEVITEGLSEGLKRLLQKIAEEEMHMQVSEWATDFFAFR